MKFKIKVVYKGEIEARSKEEAEELALLVCKDNIGCAEVKVTELMDKKHCVGCEDNFYNANNPHGVKECWAYKKAKIVLRKKVHKDQTPPWNHEPNMYPSCYRQKNFVFFEGDRKKW